jgi:hypothetical protein
MPPRPTESMAQAEVLHRLRYAIDTAIAYPSPRNVEAATSLALDHPRALRSSHLTHNLGAFRWRWLDEHGVHEAGGAIALKAVVTAPEVVK